MGEKKKKRSQTSKGGKNEKPYRPLFAKASIMMLMDDRLKSGDIRVYLAIVSQDYSQPRKGYSWPSRRLIAALCGKPFHKNSEQWVDRRIKRLVEVGLLEVRRRKKSGKHNSYHYEGLLEKVYGKSIHDADYDLLRGLAKDSKPLSSHLKNSQESKSLDYLKASKVTPLKSSKASEVTLLKESVLTPSKESNLTLLKASEVTPEVEVKEGEVNEVEIIEAHTSECDIHQNSSSLLKKGNFETSNHLVDELRVKIVHGVFCELVDRYERVAYCEFNKRAKGKWSQFLKKLEPYRKYFINSIRSYSDEYRNSLPDLLDCALYLISFTIVDWEEITVKKEAIGGAIGPNLFKSVWLPQLVERVEEFYEYKPTCEAYKIIEEDEELYKLDMEYRCIDLPGDLLTPIPIKQLKASVSDDRH